jgi:hypothetical protein
MGGESSSTFQLNSGHGVFEGNISLDNGGFSSVRYRFKNK